MSRYYPLPRKTKLTISFSPLIADDIGPLILLIFFGCLIGAIVYVFFFIPETKGTNFPSSYVDPASDQTGHSLEEIDELYRSKVKPWKSSSWQPSVKRSAIDAVEGNRRASEATMVEKTANKGEAGHIESGHKTSRESTPSSSMSGADTG